MKVLTIQQPWASLVAHGHKEIETRSWKTKYRGELLIHAGMGKQYKKIPPENIFWREYHKLFAFENMPPIEQLPYGAIIGKVNLVTIIPCENIDSSGDVYQQSLLINADKSKINSNCATISPQEYACGDFADNRFGWLLSDPILFDVQIPCKGQLSLWNFDESKLLIK